MISARSVGRILACESKNRTPELAAGSRSTPVLGLDPGASRWCARRPTQQAGTTANVPYLDAILYLLGITREEIDTA